MYDIRYICRIGCVFCINIQVWGYGFASDKVFCAPLLGVFVVFLIVFFFLFLSFCRAWGTVSKVTVTGWDDGSSCSVLRFFVR